LAEGCEAEREKEREKARETERGKQRNGEKERKSERKGGRKREGGIKRPLGEAGDRAMRFGERRHAQGLVHQKCWLY